jgi:predicted transcriptional regulator
MKMDATNKADLLSKEFKVACAIFSFNKKDEKIWFTKLCGSLEKDGIAKSTVLNALKTLFDYGIVKAEYGETEKGRPGRLLFVAGEATQTIGKIWEEYWQPTHPL